MKSIFNFPKTILSHFSIARQCHFKSFKDKYEVFRVLNSIYIKSKFYKKESPVTQKIFGFSTNAYDYNALMFLFKEVFIGNEYYFKSENNTPLIFDCGANIGMSILYFKKLFPNASIVAFEPNPQAFSLLKKNVEGNKLTNVTIHNIGLSSISGTIDFYLGSDSGSGSLVGSIFKERGGKNLIKVQTSKLSDFFSTNNVDLVKIDIEGAETQVLDDLFSTNSISKAKQYIIEYHHRIDGKKSDLSSFLLLLERSNYEYNLKAEFDGVSQFQDILIYVKKNLE